MKYIDLISNEMEYKYSTNISFDLHNESKLARFIPNNTTIEIMREYLLGIINDNSSPHARILYGSYGTGKSHLLTVLSAILGQINTSGEGYKILLRRISRYDADLAHDINKFVEEKKSYLVVPIVSDYSAFDRCVFYSLKRELFKNGINAKFNSFYDEALELVRKWDNRDDSKLRLIEECQKYHTNVEKLINGLKQYDSSFENIFENIFNGMTYGANFVSGVGNLIDNLKIANEAIKDKFKGIIFVFDEFGRYFEDYGEEIKVKSIQDMAEFCDHCDYDNYLILVSHKQLSIYAERLSKSLNEEWKKVEGRFRFTSINVKYDQCLSLIPYIIPKTSNWIQFKSKYEKNLNSIYAQAWEFKGFLFPEEFDENPFEGGFPLHPITLFSLDRLSKKVAQNERTFFTFLAGDEEYSLCSYLKKIDIDKFHFVGIDVIYDYFESNIKTYKSDDVYSVYRKLQVSLNKLIKIEKYKSLMIKILKTMATINIIGDMEVLSNDEYIICHVIDEDEEEIKNALHKLEEVRIIKFMRQYGYYDFFDSSNYDINAMVDDKLTSISDDMVINTLNEDFCDFVIYPYEYNEYYKMTRIINPVFTLLNELNKKSFNKNVADFYDGIIAFVLDSGNDISEYFKLEQLPERTILFINNASDELILEVKKYIALQYFVGIKDDLAKNDPTILNELKLYLGEQKSIISDLISKWKNFELKNLYIIESRELRNMDSFEKLSSYASMVMSRCFDNTIIINNDLINKNNLTGAMNLARKKAISFILSNDNIYADCALLSPEYTILRSVLSKNGIYKDDSVKKINKSVKGENLGNSVIEVIENYLKLCSKSPKSFEDTYIKLKNQPYGLRDGYIPVLLAYFMKEFIKNVTIYSYGVEQDVVPEIIIDIVSRPKDYSIYICEWTKEQEQFINNLESLFGMYISIKDAGKNRLKALYIAMNTHYSNISKCARTTEKYASKKTKLYREIMSMTYKDYNEFFFKTMSAMDNDLASAHMTIKSAYRELEEIPEVISRQALSIIRRVFDLTDSKISVTNLLKCKYNNEWVKKSGKSFDYYTNTFLDYLRELNVTTSDDKLVTDISKRITGFEITYWGDSQVNNFEDTLNNIYNTLNIFQLENVIGENEIKLVFETSSGKQKAIVFNQGKLSDMSKTMMNKLNATVNNFGHSISYEEKVQVLVAVLNGMIEK